MTPLADQHDRDLISSALDDTLIVEAAAGTGKTEVLSRRLARLAEEGTGPERVLVIASTRATATRLRKRAEVLLETYIFDFTGSTADVAYALERAARRGDIGRRRGKRGIVTAEARRHHLARRLGRAVQQPGCQRDAVDGFGKRHAHPRVLQRPGGRSSRRSRISRLPLAKRVRGSYVRCQGDVDASKLRRRDDHAIVGSAGCTRACCSWSLACLGSFSPDFDAFPRTGLLTPQVPALGMS